MRISSRYMFVCALAAGCSSSTPNGTSSQPLIVGACEMAATNRVLGDASLSFDTRTGAVAYDLAVPRFEVVGTATSSECFRKPQGYVATLTGTGTWEGTPDHRFALNAVHIPGEIATPEPGWIIDSASLHVMSPTGELVHGNSGFVDAPFDTVAASYVGGGCMVSGTGTLESRDRVTITGVNTEGISSGTLEVLGAPGGGPRTRIEMQIGFMTCRINGVRIGDVHGYGTIDGVGGYTFVAHFEDSDGDLRDYALVVAFDLSGQEVLRIGDFAPPGSFSVVN